MTVADNIVAARRFGVVHCGISSQLSPNITELAGEFGLRGDSTAYREVDEATARESVKRLLHRDLAYSAEVMPEREAARLTEDFFAQFDLGSKYFTNNSCPVTDATFDEGVLVIGRQGCGCFWVEDED
jgi:hypothetical protein